MSNRHLFTKKLNKQLILSLIVLLALLVLVGCRASDAPINSESTGYFNQLLVYPFSWLLLKVAVLFGGSYGLSIIVVTLFVRLMLFPLMVKQNKNTRALQQIQPKLEELKKKYVESDKKTQQKLQEETLKLYKTEGINPLGMGCLPLLVQMPVMMAFYYAIMRTEELALHSFLWFDLGAPDPLYLLPILAAITTFLQTKLSAKQTTQNSSLAVMSYIMPAMILYFALRLPTALSLYWVVGGVFGIVQAYIFSLDRTTVKQQVAKT